ncbi:vacuolar fusion protein CCZ1 homolog isoform X1 [Anastrepha ludens]|uniref:vacuolar fusion protein CCZ1 homolog isoform X1 n=1 Tax=Anastrepha ludens TaxID=28586 RepID=UPI0023AF6BC9|nr:vacuolar fusion protein CCZ1 homolog isoform X1 [Anastrepha ludens]
MSNILQRVETTLRSFYIFNSKFGQKEGDEFKKILYYNPQDIELNTKIKDVGLSEAIIQFTSTFVGEDDCKALHTQKTTQIFYQPECGYWMVMVLNVPKEIKSKDGIEVPEYRGAEVQDRIYRTVLRQCYKMFRLSCGTFLSNTISNGDGHDCGREQLQERLSKFFNKYLQSLRIPVNDVLSFMHSIQYLPLEQPLFLRAHNFINMIRATFPIIKETVLLYDERIVCGGQIGPIELCNLHQYLVNSFLEKSENTIRNAHNDSPIVDKYHSGVFITGQENDLPKIYLTVAGNLQCYYLLIFRVLNATLCLLLSDKEDLPKNDFCTELHTYMGPQLSRIVKDIEENINKQQSLRKQFPSTSLSALTSSTNTDDFSVPKYLFINEQSLKHLTNIPPGSKSSHYIPSNVINLIADLNPYEEGNLEEYYSSLKEVQIKTTNDFWIVQRCWNWRQCYVIIHNSKATLLDITQEAKRVFDKEFTDDVFFDK